MNDHFDDDNSYATQSAGASHAVQHTAAIVPLAGRRWLLGMTWHTYEGVLDRNELLEEAETLNADWIARRAGDEVVQVGYCAAASATWPSKIYSLSALLADSHKVPWAGAFDLGNGQWWYIAVRDNYTIMPDGDVVGSYEDILRARQEHASIEDFNHVDGTREDLERLINNSAGRRTGIESVTGSRFTPRQKMGAAVAIGLLILCGGGFLYWKHLQAENALALTRAKPKPQASPAAQQPVSPDLATYLIAKPDPAVWLAACADAVDNSGLWDRGWQLTSQHCMATEVKRTWRRRNNATVGYMPAGILDDDGNGVTQSAPLRFAAAQGSNESLPFIQARYRVILWAQLHGIEIHIHGDPDAAAKAAQGAMPLLPGQTPPPPPVRQVGIDFTVSSAPFALDFSGLVGFRLTEVELVTKVSKDPDSKQFREAEWKISGVLYGR